MAIFRVIFERGISLENLLSISIILNFPFPLLFSSSIKSLILIIASTISSMFRKMHFPLKISVSVKVIEEIDESYSIRLF